MQLKQTLTAFSQTADASFTLIPMINMARKMKNRTKGVFFIFFFMTHRYRTITAAATLNSRGACLSHE